MSTLEQEASLQPSLPTAACSAHKSFVCWAEEVADRLRWVYFLLLGVAYLLGYTTSWRTQTDSAFYLETGRNISRGFGFTYHGEPNRLAYPGLPKLLALAHSWFPAAAIPVANALLLLMALAALAATYQLLKRVVGRPKAVIVTVFFASSVPFMKESYTIMTDVPFYLGMVACLLGFECAGWLTAPASAASPARADRIGGCLLVAGGFLLAALMRPMVLPFAATIALAAVVIAIRRRTGRSLWLVVALMLLLAAAAIYIDPRRAAGHFDQYEQQVLQRVSDVGKWYNLVFLRNVSQFVDDVLPGTFFGFSFGYYGNIAVSLLFAALVLWQLVRVRLLWMLWVVAVWAVMLGVVPQDRYLLPVLPLLILAWWQWVEWVDRRLAGRRGDVLAVGLYVLLFPAAGRGWATVWLEQMRTPLVEYNRDGRFKVSEEMAELIRKHTLPGDVIVADERQARVISYLADRQVVARWTQVPRGRTPAQLYGVRGVGEAFPRGWLRRLQAVPDPQRTWRLDVSTRAGRVEEQLYGLVSNSAATRPARVRPATRPAKPN